MAVLVIKLSPYGGYGGREGLLGMAMPKFWIATGREVTAHLWVWDVTGRVVSRQTHRSTKWSL